MEYLKIHRIFNFQKENVVYFEYVHILRGKGKTFIFENNKLIKIRIIISKS